MGSFFLLCDIYFDLVEQSDITSRGGWRWDLGKAEKQYYYDYYQAILYIFLMVHCLLWKCIFTVITFKCLVHRLHKEILWNHNNNRLKFYSNTGHMWWKKMSSLSKMFLSGSASYSTRVCVGLCGCASVRKGESCSMKM